MLTKPRILLVDDQIEVFNAYQRVFEQNGFDVQTAEDGTSALDTLYGKHFECVVTDILMPPERTVGIWLVHAIS